MLLRDAKGELANDAAFFVIGETVSETIPENHGIAVSQPRLSAHDSDIRFEHCYPRGGAAMSENHQPEKGQDESSTSAAEATGSSAERSEPEQIRHDHDDKIVDEWEDESFPASDPPGHY